MARCGEWLGLSPEIHRSSELGIPGEQSERLLRLCEHFGARTYLSGSAARDYLDVALFARRGVEVAWQDYVHPEYPQQFGAFVPYLSAIDLLLNCGEESRRFSSEQSPERIRETGRRVKTFLVTGGAGFIGSNFVHHLFDKYPDYRILVLDLLTYAGSVDNLPTDFHDASSSGRIEFWYGDVRNASLVDNLVAGPTWSCTSPPRRMSRGRSSTTITSSRPTCSARRSSPTRSERAKRVNRFIHISTSEVYGTAIRR